MTRNMRGSSTHKVVRQARENRTSPTVAEKILWEALRGRRLDGMRFRRQHPYGFFILDFFSVEHDLAVEVDGSIHEDSFHQSYDQNRTQWLVDQGVRVLRFKNEDVEQHLDWVLAEIRKAAKDQV